MKIFIALSPPVNIFIKYTYLHICILYFTAAVELRAHISRMSQPHASHGYVRDHLSRSRNQLYRRPTHRTTMRWPLALQ